MSGSSAAPQPTTAMIEAAAAKETLGKLNFCQWQNYGNGIYVPTSKTIKTIPAGFYWTGHNDNIGLFLQLRKIINDGIVYMPDSASAKVLASMEKFWNSKARYDRFNLLFKRGILLWGPPGSGKTITVRQLAQQVVDRDGIVINCEYPGQLANLLRAVRTIEPVRPIICIYEDVDEIIARYNEHDLLALLDGETQVDNIVHIATTNYPDRLGARLINRPSRFDERIFVGMPSAEQRTVYLKAVAPDCPDIDQWVKDTDDFSIAHLRELVAAVYCLEGDYQEVLKRLKDMNERPKEVDGFNKPQKLGFKSNMPGLQGAC